MNTRIAPSDLRGAPDVSAQVETEIVRDLAGFRALGPEWTALFERAGEPQQVFQRFAMLDIWARHYLDAAARLHIVVVRRAGQVSAIVPLVRERRFGLETLRFMGAPVAQFDDALVTSGEAEDVAGAIADALRRSGADMLEARRVRMDAALRRVLPKRGRVFEPQRAPSACLQRRVAADGGPGTGYSARDRSNFRRRMRRLTEFGALRVENIGSGPDAAAIAAAAIDMKIGWLESRAIASPTVRDPRFKAFFAEAAASPEAGLHTTVIRLDGRPVAIDLSFDCKHKSFGHVIASDPGFEREGLGQLMIHHVFAAARARGNAAFELLTPLDEYKLRHADAIADVESFVLPLTLRGRMLGVPMVRHAVPAAKILARRLPASFVERLARN